MRSFIFFLFFALSILPAMAQEDYIPDQPFMQEYHEPYPVGSTPDSNEVRSIAVDELSNIWIATPAGVFTKMAGMKKWVDPLPTAEGGPAYAVLADQKKGIWIANWKGVYYLTGGSLIKLTGTAGPVSVLCSSREGIYALGPRGVWLFDGNRFVKKNYAIGRSVRDAISDGTGGLWVATDAGLFHSTRAGTRQFTKPEYLVSAAVKQLGFDAKGKLWAGGLGGVSIFNKEIPERKITPAGGCPSIFVRAVSPCPTGQMWIGTDVGVVRFDEAGNHSLLFSRRWLLNDQVNDIAFDRDGTAWIATTGGVSAIRKRKMTLVSKQDFFYDILMKRHIRAPWISGQCRLTTPGDITTWQPDDDDNDGEYTSNYLAQECFRYAATKDDDAKIKAKKAFDFLKKLQDVTGSNGFFARTMVPVSWKAPLHDTNVVYTSEQLAEEEVKDPRFKPVEERWRKSADGEWLWKGDASSDEMCGHMMGYYFYYTLVADSLEKQRVARHVASIVDHLIANDFNMMDTDGTHTRWSVWSPDLLNRDPEWSPDKNQNSMEILTFLKLAFYVTGNKKYQDHYLRLITQEHYLDNMQNVKDQNAAWFIYFDVVLQAYLYPILLHCETDPQLLAFYRQHIEEWMERRKKDKNPLINFFYTYSTNKVEGLSDSYHLLVDAPLDLIDWPIDHTKREDIQIVHSPVLDEWQVSELPPASIRSAIRWDRNPWSARGGAADIEREPVYWLLPYWMGRYLKLIR